MIKVLLLLFCLFLALPNSFHSFKDQMEAKVFGIAKEMESIFAKRCESNIATCEILSYNECEGTSQQKCYEDFPKAETCLTEGVKLSKISAVRLPPGVDANNLTKEEKQFICTSALLEDKFHDLEKDREKRFGKAYIGTSSGSFRSYPTLRKLDEETGKCTEYDPRYRPWYTTATSGSKNILLFIDVSSSMNGFRIKLAKDAAIAVIKTLSINDFVGVIIFAKEAKTLFSNKIVRAKSETKDSLIQKIQGIKAFGSTNYEAAIRKGFSLLNAAERDEYGAPCRNGQNVFLFLTDGNPTAGLSTSSELISLINSYDQEITMFTYALGEGADKEILQDLACEFHGILFQIQDTGTASKLTSTMKNYYTYLSEGIEVTSPVWTEPYIDSFGFGKMVTVSMPIYYEESGIRAILGVAGIDILWEQFSIEVGDGRSEEEIISELIIDGACLKSNLTECQIDELRQYTCESGCNSSGHIATCSETPNNVFQKAEDTNSNICCGITIAEFAGVMATVVGVLGIGVGVIIYCKKCKKDQSAQEEVRIDHSQGRVDPDLTNPSKSVVSEIHEEKTVRSKH